MIRQPVLFPTAYVLYVVMAMLDITLTWCILQLGGYEVNPVAAFALDRHGLAGMIALKYITIVLVVLSCEYIGRQRRRLALNIADGAAAIHIVPTGLATVQIGMVA